MNNTHVVSSEALSRLHLFRYWRAGEFQIIIDGQPVTITCSAGSNESPTVAENLCAAKAERVQLIIDGAIERESNYEKPVREEITHEIDEYNIVTRNRYGALVLNSSSVSIFDIDDYKRSFWEAIGFGAKKDKKTAIVEHLRGIFAKHRQRDTSWRIYETCKGIRMIMVGQYLSPSSQSFEQFSREINADPLYTMLCARQSCYRARLTPKPHRLHIDRLKFTCPLPDDVEGKYDEWLANYQDQSKNYTVCRLLEVLGTRISEDPIIDFHDRVCCSDISLPLA
ncbi:MAG: hypothetical protein CVV41_17380 [Candidatus Riflebacteria bacterium HGW-Riflebacteria-1]|jgi:hypothetical protein|nr:MAG: hypothetical protein CVV41_17380 [Candidatus Riflebacteria bacterium HGW-Riflebacteria-1]